MPAKSYILRSDDGKLYRVTKDQLAAFQVGPNDPAQKYVKPLAQLETSVQQAAKNLHVEGVCFTAVVEGGSQG
jgi:hypothetical protein